MPCSRNSDEHVEFFPNSAETHRDAVVGLSDDTIGGDRHVPSVEDLNNEAGDLCRRTQTIRMTTARMVGKFDEPKQGNRRSLIPREEPEPSPP